MNNRALTSLVIDSYKQLKAATSSEDLLQILDQLKNFPDGLRFNNTLLNVLGGITLVAGIIFWFLPLELQRQALFAYLIAGMGLLFIGFGFGRQWFVKNLGDSILQRDAEFDNGIIADDKAKLELDSFFSFSMLDHPTIQKIHRNQENGYLFEIKHRIHDFGKGNRYSAEVRNSKGQKAYKTEIRYALMMPFQNCPAIEILHDAVKLRKSEGFTPALNEFNETFSIRGEDDVNTALFINAHAVLQIMEINAVLKHCCFEIRDGHILITTKSKIMNWDLPKNLSLYEIDDFIAFLKQQTSSQNYSQLLSFVNNINNH
ncbi:hypothetical protein J3998_03140 [Thiomicrorhabdus sp. 6S2-11]|uniref:DUF3137 domain-containing protein n=1 Tax=Thiomicrorhabdus marina TaxID=2818442 RepID=A0ABS3Q404_9GAMM|nr:hypothetical protein [Thiomicrorhabdus marina]MBO1926560.1 hypothetical protein [Thiomicrorhabdus marina]